MIYFILCLMAAPITWLFLLTIMSHGAIKRLSAASMIWAYAGVLSLIFIPFILVYYA